MYHTASGAFHTGCVTDRVPALRRVFLSDQNVDFCGEGEKPA